MSVLAIAQTGTGKTAALRHSVLHLLHPPNAVPEQREK